MAAGTAASAQGPADPQSATPQEEKPQTYYEFGTVYSIGQRSVDVRVYDQAKHTVVQHNFELAKDTRADVVRVGDVVEVIYSSDGGVLTARRLLLTGGGVPKAGGTAASPGSGAGTKPAGKAVAKAGAMAAGSAALSARGGVNNVSLGKTVEGKVPGAVSVGLGEKVEGRIPSATALGALNMGGGEAATPKLAQPRLVAHDRPTEECNRSDAGWAQQPIRIGVMDFRYPTDKEEEADLTAKGGGSGTLVADLVFDRLGRNADLQLGRGDRDKLYRGDFAGAARVGRQMGMDAVLAGTFQPVEQKTDQDGFTTGPKMYELKAGLVDTCTGQLLMRLVSVKCADGSIPDVAGPSGPAQGCTRYSVTAKQAADPRDDPHSFGPALDAMIGPLVTVPAAPGGKVKETAGNAVRIAGLKAKVGDTIAIHASRLAKNVTTDTLRNLMDEEIGRVVVTAVSGGVATGTFTGDYVPRAGDAAAVLEH